MITIQGLKNSGKDELGRIIQYLTSTPKVLHKYNIYKILNKFPIKHKYSINSYANTMKKMLASLFNIDYKLFNDRDFKENTYINFNTLTLHKRNEIVELNLSPIPDELFDQFITNHQNIMTEYLISIRQLLQYFGTEVMKKHFGNKLWTLSTLKENNQIITDQRFIVENSEARKKNAIILHITRPICKAGKHSSEREVEELLHDRKYNYLIENDGSLEDLFNKAKLITYTITYD